MTHCHTAPPFESEMREWLSVLHSFDNSTPIADIANTFARL